MNNRLEPTAEDVDKIRTIFEIRVAEDLALNLPSNLQDFRDPANPLRYINQPAWLSSMWYGFLLSRRTTWVYRHPEFEGDYVHADQFIDQGIRISDRSAKCEADSIRVPAGEFKFLLDYWRDAHPEDASQDGWYDKISDILHPVKNRDARAKKK